MISNTIKGDLIKAYTAGDVQVLVHGCNCFHTMGAGIAKFIKQAYPEVLIADKQTPYGKSSKLGTWSSVSHDNGEKSIINMYTQYHYSRRKDGKPNIDYNAIEKGFSLLNTHFKDTNKIIGIPLIGAGLAGGNWDHIEELINDSTPDIKIHLYKL